MGRIGILQPSYLPWLGFFEQMSRCDTFVFLDDVQYTKNDWRNRNRIKTKEGVQWLSVPVSFQFGQKIKDIRIIQSDPWQKKHLQALKTWYGKSRFFDIYFEEIEHIVRRNWLYLIDLDIELTHWIMRKIKLKPKMIFSSQLLTQTEDRQLRLIEICKKLNCNFFYEGQSGRNYIDTALFTVHGITIEFQNYIHPYYNQLWQKEQGFISHLSIIDLFLNHGPDSLDILKGQTTITKPENIQFRNAHAI